MVYESMHKRRLHKCGIRIVTEYYDGGITKRRSSDGSVCDDVNNGVILDKQYFHGDKQLLQETEFNPGILYSFVYPETKDGLLRCPACGGTAARDDFSEGCPFCGAPGNLEYAERKAGQRDHSDFVKSRSAKNVLLYLLCIAVGIAICMPITLCSGRTALLMDYIKGAGIGLGAGSIAFLAFLYIRSKLDIHRDEMEKQQRQSAVMRTFFRDLTDTGLSVKAFHNGLSQELNRYFYEGEDASVRNVIDYDVLDFRNQKIEKKENAQEISADILLRTVTEQGAALSAKQEWRRVTLLRENRNRKIVLHEGLNMIDCPNCGAKVNVEETLCRYCGSPVVFKREMTLISLARTDSDRL